MFLSLVSRENLAGFLLEVKNLANYTAVLLCWYLAQTPVDAALNVHTCIYSVDILSEERVGRRPPFGESDIYIVSWPGTYST